MNEDKTQLAELAAEADFLEILDWDALDISKAEVINAMADKVIAGMTSIDEKDRLVVAMATMCKLLVENMVLQAMVNKQNTTEK